MADHSYTFLKLQQAAAHAVGLDVTQFDVNTGNTAAGVVNDAIVQLWTMRRWRWRQASETLALTQGQSYIALSGTYGRTLSIAGYPGTNYGVRMVNVDQVNLLRQRTGLTGFDLYVATSWTAQASASVPPVARFEIFPTPAATVSSALTHVYEKRLPALSGDTDVPDCPPQYLVPLERLVRYHARERVLGDGTGAGQLAAFQMLIRPMIDEDNLSQPFASRVPGVTDMMSGIDLDRRRFEPFTSATVST